MLRAYIEPLPSVSSSESDMDISDEPSCNGGQGGGELDSGRAPSWQVSESPMVEEMTTVVLLIAPTSLILHLRVAALHWSTDTLGARGHLPGRPIVSSLWVLKQFTPTLPGGSMLGTF